MKVLITALIAATVLMVGLPVQAQASDLEVMFQFEARHRCSKLSPEITVGNVPEGTKSFKVKMIDFQARKYKHGGGTVENDGSGKIAEGALKSYKGPCPPSGKHTYQFTVKALDAEGDTLASGKAKQRF